jgi:L-serine dehydratase
MNISVFDLFKIGIGPSSSHTVGPMYAAKQFLFSCMEEFPLTRIYSIKIELFGSLALTGKGHGSDTAILMGLEGEEPASIDPEQIPNRIKRIRKNRSLCLMNERKIQFEEEISLIFKFDDLLPHHSNGIRFTVFDADGTKLREEDFYSVGGGFILNTEEIQNKNEDRDAQIPFQFPTCHSRF